MAKRSSSPKAEAANTTASGSPTSRTDLALWNQGGMTHLLLHSGLPRRRSVPTKLFGRRREVEQIQWACAIAVSRHETTTLSSCGTGDKLAAAALARSLNCAWYFRQQEDASV